ncbi:MAG: hypothetical protein NT144_08330 [Bacteroidia bacterium]|nr:hypothetical protein [Bacteroidia bacterium]
MEIKYFSLGISENNKFVKIFKIVFGVVCFAVAIFWMIFNIKSLKPDGTAWITIIFLSGFGFYQILSGLGRATRFIEIGNDCIRLKKNPVLPPVVMSEKDIEKIELYPMNLIFFLKTKKRILLRFGSTFYETNELIKDEILGFAESNKIPLEIIQEEL